MTQSTSPPIIAINAPIMLFDGGSQGNPGQGAAAAILLMPNGRRYTVSQLISFATKQETEYIGLIIGLKKARQLNIRALDIKGNSDTVFNQVNGIVQVQDEPLRVLYQEALKFMQGFDHVSVEWITPEQNRPARAAVSRCISDALGREKASRGSTESRSISQTIAHLIQLGSQATDDDYRHLSAEPDEWTDKPLAQLRSQIALEVQDAIALQWQGDETDLAEMYRWYLRGLPPEMASRKVNLERAANEEEVAKLPWEEALIAPIDPLIAEPDSDLFAAPLPEEFPSPMLPEEVVKADLIDLELSVPFSPTPPDSAVERFDAEAIFRGDPLAEMALSNPLSTLPDAAPNSIEEITDSHKDTLPSETRVSDLVAMIENLSPAEKMTLAKELVKFPDIVNLILQAIADSMARNQ